MITYWLPLPAAFNHILIMTTNLLQLPKGFYYLFITSTYWLPFPVNYLPYILNNSTCWLPLPIDYNTHWLTLPVDYNYLLITIRIDYLPIFIILTAYLIINDHHLINNGFILFENTFSYLVFVSLHVHCREWTKGIINVIILKILFKCPYFNIKL